MEGLKPCREGQERHPIRHIKILRRNTRSLKTSTRLRVIRALWTFFCVLACSYHSFQVTSIYFQRDINAEAFYFRTDPIIPPMVTVCLTAMHFKKPCPAPSVEGKCLPFMTTPQKFFDNSYKFDELMKSLRITNSENKEDFYSGKSLIGFKLNFVITYKWLTSICYSIDYLMSFKTRFYKHVDVQAMSTAMLVLEFHFAPSETVLVTLSSRRNIPSRLTGGTVQLSKMRNGTTHYVSYRKKELSLLPPPYVTRCRDYENEGIHEVTTQDKCVRYCQLRKTMAVNGGVRPYDNLVIQDYSSRDDNRILETNASKPMFLDHCRTHCGLIECEIDDYLAWTTFEEASMNLGPGSGIALQLPTEADLKVNYKPKTAFWEYATLFGSVIGLWFGLSVQNCEHLAEKIISKWKKRK